MTDPLAASIEPSPVPFDRRRLRRRLMLWRGAAIALGALALIVLAFRGGSQEPGGFGAGQHIARIDISGLITEDRQQLELLKRVAEDSSVSAVLLAIDSPGGTTTGGEAIEEAVERLAQKKPVVAVCGTVAASAAYMIAIATDHIVARGNTITGSVGVIFQYPEVSGALDKLGIKMHEIKSGPLKASPSMFQPLDEGGRALTEELVKEGQVWFLDLVAKRRKVTPSAIPGLVEGRVYSGRQALNLKLIDAIGGEREAVSWLEGEKGIKSGLKIRDWRPQRESAFSWFDGADSSSLLGRVLGGAADAIPGLGPITERLQLDGLLSVWQGQ